MNRECFYLPEPEIVAVSLGANIGKPVYRLRQAVEELRRFNSTKLLATSGLYHTAPVGPVVQPPYINAAVLLKTRLAPIALLAELKAIEHSNGRKEHGRSWGPRVLDMDIITYGNQIINKNRLKIPHPEAHLRHFVLRPLYEIAPDLNIPGRGKTRDLINVREESNVYHIGTLKPLARQQYFSTSGTKKRRRGIARRMHYFLNGKK